jgi:nifR3 family TIM-barrel protein
MQLYGADADRLCAAAQWAENRGAHVIDLNMGCPADKVTRQNGGSKLLCDPDNTLRIVEKIKACLTRVPLTCKLRLGWNDSSLVAPYLARRLEEIGVALITIHGRTTAMKFSGQVRLEGIAAVVAAVKKIPVIGNGDIKTPDDARRMMEATRCAGVMIGRGALVRPWIFRDTWSYLTTGTIPAEPTIQEKCALMQHHFHNMLRFRNEHAAVREMRTRISWYARAMHPCRPLKDALRQIKSAADFDHVLATFLDWRLRYDGDVAAGRAKAIMTEATETV